MNPLLTENEKKSGVCYSVSSDGIELPIIDMTHPAFAINPGAAEMGRITEKFIHNEIRRQKVPAFFQKIMLRLALRHSILARGLQEAQGSFLSGMDTYLMKLGPGNLGKNYSVPVDHKIASSLPALSMRLRLQDLARLLGGSLIPLLQVKPEAPLHLIALAGGTAIECLNALILINKKHPQKLAGRQIVIQVLDLASEAPTFGARALEALCAEGSVLHGLKASFEYLPYDWARAENLKALLQKRNSEGALTALSSEGGLFEYGSDSEILANLEVLRDVTPPDAFITGSVTRSDGPAAYLHKSSKISTRPRTLDAFQTLVQQAGWSVTDTLQRPFSHNVRLSKISS